MELSDFEKALAELGKVQDGIINVSTKYKDISNLIEGRGDDVHIKTDPKDNDKIKLYKYLTYLFVGGLTGEVNIATGNMRPYPKGLNLRLKDMNVENFKKLLEQGSWGEYHQ